eukprot:2171427-Amphidinium_carterae.1
MSNRRPSKFTSTCISAAHSIKQAVPPPYVSHSQDSISGHDFNHAATQSSADAVTAAEPPDAQLHEATPAAMLPCKLRTSNRSKSRTAGDLEHPRNMQRTTDWSTVQCNQEHTVTMNSSTAACPMVTATESMMQQSRQQRQKQARSVGGADMAVH